MYIIQWEPENIGIEMWLEDIVRPMYTRHRNFAVEYHVFQ